MSEAPNKTKPPQAQGVLLPRRLLAKGHCATIKHKSRKGKSPGFPAVRQHTDYNTKAGGKKAPPFLGRAENMKLKLSKKTYYMLGVLAGALTLVRAVAAMAGLGLALLDSVAFGCAGLMLLFLASVKGTPMEDKRSLFGCFLLLIASVFFNAPLLQIVLMGLVWPCFAAFEKNRDERLAPVCRLVFAAEFLWMGLRVLAELGELSVLAWPSNLAGTFAAAARLWLCVKLYKRERDER